VAITTELVIARHGEAQCNVLGIVGGERGCTGLTDNGQRQGRQLAARVGAEHRNSPFDAFYTTPRLRVRQTADLSAEALGVAATVEPELRGLDHGDADAQRWHDIKTAFGGPPHHKPDTPYALRAETWNQYLQRASAALQTIIHRNAGQRILIIGHGETIEAAHTLLLDPSSGARRSIGFITDHTCISRWQLHVNRFGREVWMLAAHNDTAHLAAEP
jgi:probable phosphoglycerate mutase